jgi:hypothetical protein
VKEVTEACDAAVEPIVQNEARLKRIKDQLEARERMERGEKPTLEQLKDKYGENWGLSQPGNVKTPDQKAEENRTALEREQARVRAEYEEMGIKPPSKLALSPTALRIIAEQNAAREEVRSRNQQQAQP